jgi:chaperonin cofactor prefoldin
MNDKQLEMDTEWLMDQLVETIREKVCAALRPTLEDYDRRLEKLERNQLELQQEVQAYRDELRAMRALLASVEALLDK